MRKIIAFILALCLLISLCSCGKTDEQILVGEQSEPNEQNIENETKDIIDFGWAVGFSKEGFGRCIDEVVELTTDNWKDYLKVVSYNKENMDILTIGVNTDKLFGIEDFAMELEDVESGEKFTLELHSKSDELLSSDGRKFSCDLSKYNCTKVEGRIYFLTIPDEMIYDVIPEFDRPGIVVIGCVFELIPETGRIKNGAGEGNWKDKFMVNN